MPDPLLPDILMSTSDSGRIRIFGLLTVDTVGDYQQKGYEVISGAEDTVIFDLEEADVVGSAVIALLISWQRRALELGKGFVIANAPGHLIAMADLSGLSDVISFQKITDSEELERTR